MTVFTYDDQGRQTSARCRWAWQLGADPDDRRAEFPQRSLAGRGRRRRRPPGGEVLLRRRRRVAAYLADAADGGLTDVDEAVKYGYDAFGRQVQVIQDGDGDFTTAGDQRA